MRFMPSFIISPDFFGAFHLFSFLNRPSEIRAKKDFIPMEWDKRILSRLNRRATTRSSHLTRQVGQAGQGVK